MTTETPLQMLEFPRPAAAKNNIPVVFAADDNYAPYLATLMMSIIENGNPECFYDFITLETRISDESKRRIRAMVEPYKNVSVRFYNPSALFQGNRFHLSLYYSEETYYRLFIQTIFQHYEKILYVDVDTVVRKDIAELYKTDVTGYLFAAAVSACTPQFLHNNYRLCGVVWADYLKDTLGMADPYEYFQAGVLVINIPEITAFDLQQKALDKLGEVTPRFVDQDILNSVCQGRFKRFSLQWNLLDSMGVRGEREFALGCLKDSDREDYLRAEENPYLIHYAGAHARPWDHPEVRYANYWWHYARKTPFYEIMLKNMIIQTQRAKRSRLTVLRYRILSKITYGSRREHYLDKIKRKK